MSIYKHQSYLNHSMAICSAVIVLSACASENIGTSGGEPLVISCQVAKVKNGDCPEPFSAEYPELAKKSMPGADLSKAIPGDIYFLPERKVQLTAQRTTTSGKAAGDPPAIVESVNFTVLAPAPDPDAEYVAQHQHSASRDDDTTIATNGGLLQGASNTTSTDESLAVVKAVISAIVAVTGVAGVPAPPFAPMAAMPPVVKANACPSAYTFTTVFDPSVSDDWKAAQSALEKISGGYVTFDVDAPATPAHNSGTIDTSMPGLAYRVPIPYRLIAKTGSKPCEMPDKATISLSLTTAQALIPDRKNVAYLPMVGGSFTATTVNTTFDGGMPTSYEVKRPSEVLAIANFPLDVVNAALSTVGSVLKLRVDYSSEKEALISNYNKEIEDLATRAKNQQDVIQQEKTLKAAQQAN